MKKFLGLAFLGLACFSAPALADSNASGGVVQSETVNLGPGPFNHGNVIGSADNSVITGITFTGGFTANRIRFSGTANSVIPTTWSNEVRMQVSDNDQFFGPNNFTFVAGAGAEYTTFDYNVSRDIAGTWPVGVDPGAAGPWRVEFFDSFDDGAGADAQSVNVSLTFENATPFIDSNGNFSFGTIGSGLHTNVGELAVGNVFDLYTFEILEDGVLDITTAFQNVYTGLSLDSEIALFDSSGVLLGENDDDIGLYSGLYGLNLTAGTYTVAVGGWDTTFADGFSVTPGATTGDYRLSLSFTAVPEPSTIGILGLVALGFGAKRRRRA
jgi:hypothetical protein